MATSTHIDTESAEETSGLSEDELFDVLANHRRRCAIELLEGSQQTHDIGTMATEIAAMENNVDIEAVTSEERKRVYTSLQQSHLPKMDAAGVIEFNKQRGKITAGPGLADASDYLWTTRQPQTSWSRYYLSLAALSASILLAIWSDLWPFELFSTLVWTTVIVVAFSCAAILNWHSTSRSD